MAEPRGHAWFALAFWLFAYAGSSAMMYFGSDAALLPRSERLRVSATWPVLMVGNMLTAVIDYAEDIDRRIVEARQRGDK